MYNTMYKKYYYSHFISHTTLRAMPPKKIPNAAGDSWILLWSDAMINVFLELLEEAHDNGKRSDTGFKPEAWVQFRAGVQNVYLGDEHITVAKLRSKLDYVCIF